MGKKHILCPYCYQEFSNMDVQYQCENEERRASGEECCPKEVDPSFNEFWKTDGVESRHVFRVNQTLTTRLFGSPQPHTCERCGRISKKFVCPHCHNELPLEMVEHGSEIISVIGGPQSGKTNFIVSLIHQIRKYGYKLNLEVTPQQVGRNKRETTYELYKKAEGELFESRTVLSKTQTQKVVPWILKLESHTTHKIIYLVFYDSAGEYFTDRDNISANASYLGKSSAVIVTFDTLSIKMIRRILSDKQELPNGELTPFDQTWTTLSNYVDAGNKQMMKKPFAFVFSKFDVVLNNRDELRCNVSEFLDDRHQIRNSTFIRSGKLNLTEINNISDSIYGYLDSDEVWDEGQLANNIRQNWEKDNYKFFGVSSLGAMPREDGTLDEVSPYRVMDPLIWILDRLGGFDIPKEV